MKNTVFSLLSIASLLYSTVMSGEVVSNFPVSSEFSEESYSQYSSSFPTTENKIYPPASIYTPAKKNPQIAAGLSSLFPGLGHFYLEDLKTAGVLAGTAGTSLGLSRALPYEEPIQGASYTIFQTTYFYGVYSAYRDARLINGNSGYKYKMPTDSLSDLSYAPFQLSVLKKPEVWGGLIGALTVATGIAYFSSSSKSHSQCSLATTKPFFAFPIGIGEEAYFRGFLQPCMSEICTPWGGIAISSCAFGAAHIPNARYLSPEEQKRYYTYVLPFLTAFGVYCGWMTHKNNSLKESVALHAWYDFILMGIDAAASQASTGSSEVAISIPF